MLAVVTNRDDLTADWLILELERQRASFVRINTEDYPVRATLRWTPREASLAGPHGTLRADEVSAVWWRRPLPPAESPGRSTAEAMWAAQEARTAFAGFWAATHAHWVNQPSANALADCKPEQLLRADRLGFTVPPTLICADPGEVRAFAADHGRIICKALADGRVPNAAGGHRQLPTVVLDKEQLADLDQLDPEPACFQALVPKTSDVRVTVIGTEAHACRIDSQHDPAARVDWRRGDISRMRHEAIELPNALAARCVEMTLSYGLRFAAIDLAETKDGDHVFFELNPNGQWAWLERMSGLPLAQHLARELLDGPA